MGQRKHIGPKPLYHECAQDAEPGEAEPGAEQQPGLQLEAAVEAGEGTVVGIESPAPGVGLGVEAEVQDLEPDDAAAGAKIQVTPPRPPAQCEQAQQDRQVGQMPRPSSTNRGARKSLLGE